MNLNFLKPILQAITACFLWGIVFAMPIYLDAFSSVDIVLGRFFVYGAISTLLLIYYVYLKAETDCLKYWKPATLCAIVMNIIYFTSLIYGSRFTTPAIITLIIGTGPITITIFSCLLKNERATLNLFLIPSFSIFLGLCLISFEGITNESQDLNFLQHIQGIFFGFIALVAWTWYVIFNSKVLKTNNEINPVQWTALIGTITFGFTLIGSFLHFFLTEEGYYAQFSFIHDEGKVFWIGILVLGIFCSWAAFTLWNIAGSSLHPALSGQLSILETLFGLTLIYSLQGLYPSFLEIIGGFFIISGVSFGLYSFSKNQSVTANIFE